MGSIKGLIFWVLIAGAAFMAYATLTAPMISAAAPAILTVALAAAAWAMWATSRSPRVLPVRECPSCKEDMRRDASVCPHCRSESEPWMLDQGVWWRKVDDQWQWLNSQGAWDTRLKT